MDIAIITIIPALIAFFWSIIFFLSPYWNNHNKKKCHYIGSIMFIWGLIGVGYAAYYNHQYELYWHWESLYFAAGLSVFPLSASYLKYAVFNVKFTPVDLLRLFPAIFLFAFSAALLFLSGPGDKYIYTHRIVYPDELPINWTTMLFLHKSKAAAYPLMLIFVVATTILFNRKQTRPCPKAQSPAFLTASKNGDKRNFHYARGLFAAMGVLLITTGILNHIVGMHSPVYTASYFCLFSITIFLFGSWGYKVNAAKKNSMVEHGLRNKQGKNGSQMLSEQERMKLIIREKLLNLLEEEEIYKKPNLQLSDVSQLLHSNRSYVSSVVNSMFNTSFNNLINRYRVRCVKKLLLESLENQMSINEIREIAGFASNSSFFRIFKRKTGMTPKEYKVKLLENARLLQSRPKPLKKHSGNTPISAR